MFWPSDTVYPNPVVKICYIPNKIVQNLYTILALLNKVLNQGRRYSTYFDIFVPKRCQVVKENQVNKSVESFLEDGSVAKVVRGWLLYASRKQIYNILNIIFI